MLIINKYVHTFLGIADSGLHEDLDLLHVHSASFPIATILLPHARYTTSISTQPYIPLSERVQTSVLCANQLQV